MGVNFYDTVEDDLLKFAVIVSKTNNHWVFCKHKNRETLESPGGHRESDEDIIETAKRELKEETGAKEFDLIPVCAYSVTEKNSFNGKETFGLLCYAEIFSFEPFESEIEKIIITDELPKNWTYPTSQPLILNELKRRNII